MLVIHKRSKSLNEVIETIGGFVRLRNLDTQNVRVIPFEKYNEFYEDYDYSIGYENVTIEKEIRSEANKSIRAKKKPKVKIGRVIANAHKQNTTEMLVRKIKNYKRKPKEKVFRLADLNLDNPTQNRRRLKRSGFEQPFVFPLGVKEDVIKLLEFRASD